MCGVGAAGCRGLEVVIGVVALGVRCRNSVVVVQGRRGCMELHTRFLAFGR